MKTILKSFGILQHNKYNIINAIKIILHLCLKQEFILKDIVFHVVKNYNKISSKRKKKY